MTRLGAPSVLLGSSLLLLAPTTGCFDTAYAGAYLEAEDVSMELPDAGFRAEGVKGDASALVDQTASDVNGWVTAVVEITGYTVEFLNNNRPSSLDGEWRVYGPADDKSGRDLAWLVRVAGDETNTTFEFLIAPRGSSDPAVFELLSEGHLSVEDDTRAGTLHIDFDTIEKYPGLDLTPLWSYAGDLTIEFERELSSGEKTIEIDFDGFEAERTGYLDDDSFSSDEIYRYHKASDGSGDFHLALMGEWDTWPYTWSGAEQERMQLDMAWDATGAGRTLGTINEIDGVGDMKYGDLSLEECFDLSNSLTYRLLTEAYANELGDYNFGEVESCALELP